MAMSRSLLLSLVVLFAGSLIGAPHMVHAQEAAQPTLETSPLTIVSGDARHAFTVELAQTQEQIATGMMFRTEMARDMGMLFDMGVPRRVSFFMKNTLIPLDMLFIDSDGRVLAIAENAVPGSLRLIDPGVPVKAVLELNGGQAGELGISPGDNVEHALFAPSDGE